MCEPYTYGLVWFLTSVSAAPCPCETHRACVLLLLLLLLYTLHTGPGAQWSYRAVLCPHVPPGHAAGDFASARGDKSHLIYRVTTTSAAAAAADLCNDPLCFVSLLTVSSLLRHPANRTSRFRKTLFTSVTPPLPRPRRRPYTRIPFLRLVVSLIRSASSPDDYWRPYSSRVHCAASTHKRATTRRRDSSSHSARSRVRIVRIDDRAALHVVSGPRTAH